MDVTMRLDKLKKLLGDTLMEVREGKDAETSNSREIDTLLTDSRSLSKPKSSVFFALKTKSNDGHSFIPELYKAGVRCFVVEHLPAESENMTEATFFIVSDTLTALQTLAARREPFHGPLTVGITGSRGKTTLKEWLYQLVGDDRKVSRSPRSYNSQIGVALSLWQVDEKSDLSIIEAGISRRGEMGRLEKMISPEIVIVTNISDEGDDEFAGSYERAAEKARLIGRNTRLTIYPEDDKVLAEAVEQRCRECNTLRLPWSATNKDASLFVRIISGNREELEYTYLGKTHRVRYIGGEIYNLNNSASALAFMLSQFMDAETIRNRFENLRPVGTRLNVNEGVNNCQIVTDSYTSDFSSLEPAIDFIRRRAIPGETLTVILSDLHHETADEPTLYRSIARLLRNEGVERFIGIGAAMSRNAQCFEGNCRFFSSVGEFMQSLSPSDFSREVVLIKGSPEYDLGDVAEMLEARKHETVLEVNLDAMVKNYNYFRQNLPAGTGIVCMVKASGYGAGSYEIAKTLQDAGAAYLAVAVLDEGIDLRRNGITMPIMVMNPKVANYKSMFFNHLEPEIYSFEMLEDVIREAGKNGISNYPIHIKLDTGMHRMGFIEEELPALMDLLESQDRVVAKSVFSHLATADCPDMNDYTELQLGRFARYTDYMLSRSSRPILRHVLNSAGILRYPQYHYDMARLGIGLYGANTLPPEMEKPLEVVSTLRTMIIAVREWKAGETIGYGRRGVLKRDSRIATIPIGYADGMNRHFGNGRVSVIVNGKEAPTVGNICMDACMIDVTGIDCRVGDSVEIFGRQAGVQRLADVLDTIPYEVLTSVSPRVRRVYYRES